MKSLLVGLLSVISLSASAANVCGKIDSFVSFGDIASITVDGKAGSMTGKASVAAAAAYDANDVEVCIAINANEEVYQISRKR
jgi:hypothetical protein